MRVPKTCGNGIINQLIAIFCCDERYEPYATEINTTSRRANMSVSAVPSKKRSRTVEKILAVIGAVLVVIIAALLVIPSLIDWNGYKPQITHKSA